MNVALYSTFFFQLCSLECPQIKFWTIYRQKLSGASHRLALNYQTTQEILAPPFRESFSSVSPAVSFFHDIRHNHLKDRTRESPPQSSLVSSSTGFALFRTRRPEELEHKMHLGVMRRISRGPLSTPAGKRAARVTTCRTPSEPWTLNVKCPAFSIIPLSSFFQRPSSRESARVSRSLRLPCLRPLWTISGAWCSPHKRQPSIKGQPGELDVSFTQALRCHC